MKINALSIHRLLPISMTLGLLTGIALCSNSAMAITANQALPVTYQANHYCSDKIRADIPRGTAHQQVVGDISCINQRLDNFTLASQSPLVRYQAYRAKGWLTYSLHEDNEQSLTAAGKFALNEALSILTALENNEVKKLPFNGDIPTTSGIQRPDLWSKLLTIKQTPAFNDLTKEIAYSEIKLIWAAAEDCERGWRHSREHFSAAERWVTAAENTTLHHPLVNPDDYTTNKAHTYATLKKLEKASHSCSGTIFPSDPN